MGYVEFQGNYNIYIFGWKNLWSNLGKFGNSGIEMDITEL
jgi:hypothetical protein